MSRSVIVSPASRGVQVDVTSENNVTVAVDLNRNIDLEVIPQPPTQVIIDKGIEGPQGPVGPQGPQGPQGEPGPGVAAGGSTGQALVKSSNADYQTEWSSTVLNALTADYATNAGSAAEASHAASADYATNAGSASEASHAATATSADYAAFAGSASEANHAATATYATNAGSASEATHAISADTATYASSAGTATHATTADSASYAVNAGHATTADSATTAGNVTGIVAVVNGGTGADNATTARANLSAAKSGANSDITSLDGITGGISTADYVQFDTAYASTLVEGQLGWDGNNTLGLGMAGGNVVQKIGEDQFFYCKATAAITKGQVVMFTGAVGASGVPTGAPASGVTDGTYIMGVAAESIAHNGFGLIQCFGTLKNVNTSGYSDGDVLWYDPAVAGGLTKTKPSAPNVKVQMAAVINGGSSGGGTILIRIDPGSVLGGTDSNVQITNPTTGQQLVYNASTGIWSNSNAPVISGGTIDNTVIGSTTPAAATFTTLTANNAGNFGTTSSTVTPLNIYGGTGANNTRGIAFWLNQTGNPYARINVPSGSGGALAFYAGDNISEPTEQMRVGRTASAVNYVQVTGAATTARPVISAQGSDSIVSLDITTKGAGALRLQAASANILRLNGVAASANYFDVYQAATTKTPYFQSFGSDTNVPFTLLTQGTGALNLAPGSSGVNISNGGTVTAITRTAGGTGYTSFPSVAISAPTTAGGVQATASITVMDLRGATIVSGGTGYTVNDVLTVSGGTGTAATLTVTTVSAGVITGVSVTSFGSYTALPTNPVSVTGGTGSGATFTATYGWAAGSSLTITNAGSGYVEQPSVTFSGGGGSGAAAYATVGATPKITSIGGVAEVWTASGRQVVFGQAATAPTSVWTIYNDSFSRSLLSGSGTTGISSGGTNNLSFFTNSTAQEQFRVSHTASAVNYVQVTGAATGGSPVISSQGSDSNAGLQLRSKGTGDVNLMTNGGTNQVVIRNNSSAVNYHSFSGSATGFAAVQKLEGTDTNIALAFQSKGTGAIDLAAGSSGINVSNGGTITAITRTNSGAGYTSAPTLTISAPTTAGGVQATATAQMSISGGAFTIASGGTGYTVGDVLSVVGGTTAQTAQFTVATVSAGVITSVTITTSGSYSVLPTNPISLSGGTGTGATINVTAWNVSAAPALITNAGSGYVEQPSVTFSGGGGSGAAAYATVGGTTTFRSVGHTGTVAMRFDVPSSLSNNIPAFRLIDSANAQDSGVQVLGGIGGAVVNAFGSTNATLSLHANGTGFVRLGSGGTSQTEQMRVSHTASAVNYVQVTGGVTNANASALPGILFTGSDTTVNAAITAKGAGYIAFAGNGATSNQAFRVITTNVAAAGNLIAVQGAAAGSAPSIQAISGPSGTDTNIDLILTPKGTGVVQFGTLTATADTAISGYITIKDAGGTLRKLAVIA